MRASATFLALLLLSEAAIAQEAAAPVNVPASQVDYSRDSMLRVLRAQSEEERRKPPIRFRVGAVEFNALGTEWRFNYLPIMAPLSGTRLGITNEWPDAFALTGTPIATPKRAWRTQRQIDAELRRINESERSRARIKVNVRTNQQ